MGNIETFSNQENNPNFLVVIYETDGNNKNLMRLKKLLSKNGYNFVVLGNGDKWNGFGTKINACIKYYRKLNPEQIIVQLDARDVVVNGNKGRLVALLNKYEKILDDKLIISTEKGCCVFPTYQFPPGSFYNEELERNRRTYENSFEIHHSWEWNSEFKNINDKTLYNKLNAGMIVGKAANFIKVFDLLKIDNREDDQVLLSELYFMRPELIYLDYDNEFFSNSYNMFYNGIPTTLTTKNYCFEWTNDGWYNEETDSIPVFIQTPGKNWECYERLYERLSLL